MKEIWKSRNGKLNENWKQKWKQKMHQSHMQCLSHGLMSCALDITLVFNSSSYMTGFMSHVLSYYSCTVLCDYVFSAHVTSNVVI